MRPPIIPREQVAEHLAVPTRLLIRYEARGLVRAVREGSVIGYEPAEGSDHGQMAREHAAVFLEVIQGKGFAQPNPRPMFPNPPGLLPLEPYSEGLRDRIWWGAGTRATAEWTAEQGLNLMSSTLLTEDTGVPFHQLQAEQIQRFRDAWAAAGHQREPRVSVSRSIFPIVSDLDRAYFGDAADSQDQVGHLEGGSARFGAGANAANQACGAWPAAVCAVPVLPATVTPGICAAVPVPCCTTVIIMSRSAAALAGVIAVEYCCGLVSETTDRSAARTVCTR